jgi:hypothetical protein
MNWQPNYALTLPAGPRHAALVFAKARTRPSVAFSVPCSVSLRPGRRLALLR